MPTIRFARRHLAFACAGVLALAGAPSIVQAQHAPSLKAFVGIWSGSGTLSRQDGTTERIRCGATYAPRGPNAIQQRLNCASDSTQFNLVSEVSAQGSQLRGDWTETNRNARGDFTGSLRANLIEGVVMGPSFSASIAIVVRGRKQTVEIRSNSADIKDLRMVLTKSGR